MFFYLYTFLAILSEIIAQYLFKLNHLKNTKSLYIIIGVILYAFTGFFAYKLLKYESLAVANVLWHIFHFTVLFIISIFVLKEKMSTQQVIGLFFGVISIFLFITAEGAHHH